MDPAIGRLRDHPNYRPRGRARYHYTVATIAEIVGLQPETVRDALKGRIGDLRYVALWIAERTLAAMRRNT